MEQTSTTDTRRTLGREIMRTTLGTEEVRELKMKFADLFDELTKRAQRAEVEINKNPTIVSDETVRAHMEVIRRNEELLRCLGKACEFLEISCELAIKAITST